MLLRVSSHSLTRVQFRVDSPADGEVNMRLDDELFADAEIGIAGCRVYSWTGPWVTLGMFQDPVKALIQPTKVGWTKRNTGGKAVLHGHDITVGFAMPLAMIADISWNLNEVTTEDQEWLREDGQTFTAPAGTQILVNRSTKAAYRTLTPPLIQAMRACGLPAALGENTRFAAKGSARVADCFAFVSANDIVDERTGQKVCGCALRVTQNAALLQASIPIGTPLVDPATVIVGGKALTSTKWESERFASELQKSLA